MMIFDISKPYRTRDGAEAWAVRSPRTMGNGEVFVGWFMRDDGNCAVGSWHQNGFYRSGCEDFGWDLVNVPETRTVKVWLNVYDNDRVGIIVAHLSRPSANHGAEPLNNRIACIEREITYTVGEGLTP